MMQSVHAGEAVVGVSICDQLVVVTTAFSVAVYDETADAAPKRWAVAPSEVLDGQRIVGSMKHFRVLGYEAAGRVAGSEYVDADAGPSRAREKNVCLTRGWCARSQLGSLVHHREKFHRTYVHHRRTVRCVVCRVRCTHARTQAERFSLAAQCGSRRLIAAQREGSVLRCWGEADAELSSGARCEPAAPAVALSARVLVDDERHVAFVALKDGSLLALSESAASCVQRRGLLFCRFSPKAQRPPSRGTRERERERERESPRVGALGSVSEFRAKKPVPRAQAPTT